MSAKYQVVLWIEPELFDAMSARVGPRGRSEFIRKAITDYLKTPPAPIAPPASPKQRACPYCHGGMEDDDSHISLVRVEGVTVHSECYEKAGYRLPR